MDSNNQHGSDSLQFMHTQEHIYQTRDSKDPLHSQERTGEMLKSKNLIIPDIEYSMGVLCQNNEGYFSSGNHETRQEATSGFHGKGLQ